MIDCSKTENFIKEKERLCQYYKDKGCVFCVLDRNIKGLSCSDFIVQQPKKAIEIVQRWSNEQPPKTFLTDFLEKYPNVPLAKNGYPSICPYDLGYMTKEDCYMTKKEDFDDCSQYCKQCWNTPIK